MDEPVTVTSRGLRPWWTLLVIGALSVVLGLALVLWPRRTITIAIIVLGLYLVLHGVLRFFAALLGPGSGHAWLEAGVGIVGVALGMVVVRQPESALALVVLVVGLFWVIAGMADLFRGVTDPAVPDRAFRIGAAVLSVVAGVVLLLWPAVTVGVLALVAGIYLILVGIVEVAAALQVRSV